MNFHSDTETHFTPEFVIKARQFGYDFDDVDAIPHGFIIGQDQVVVFGKTPAGLTRSHCVRSDDLSEALDLMEVGGWTNLAWADPDGEWRGKPLCGDYDGDVLEALCRDHYARITPPERRIGPRHYGERRWQRTRLADWLNNR